MWQGGRGQGGERMERWLKGWTQEVGKERGRGGTATGEYGRGVAGVKRERQARGEDSDR